MSRRPACSRMRAPISGWRWISRHSRVVERARLVQDRVGDPELAEVVQHAGGVDPLHPVGAQAERHRGVPGVARRRCASAGRCWDRAGRASRRAASPRPGAARRTARASGVRSQLRAGSARRASAGLVGDRHQHRDLGVVGPPAAAAAGRPTRSRATSPSAPRSGSSSMSSGCQPSAPGAAAAGGVQHGRLVVPLVRPGGQPDRALRACARSRISASHSLQRLAGPEQRLPRLLVADRRRRTRSSLAVVVEQVDRHDLERQLGADRLRPAPRAPASRPGPAAAARETREHAAQVARHRPPRRRPAARDSPARRRSVSAAATTRLRPACLAS